MFQVSEKVRNLLITATFLVGGFGVAFAISFSVGSYSTGKTSSISGSPNPEQIIMEEFNNTFSSLSNMGAKLALVRSTRNKLSERRDYIWKQQSEIRQARNAVERGTQKYDELTAKADALGHDAERISQEIRNLFDISDVLLREKSSTKSLDSSYDSEKSYFKAPESKFKHDGDQPAFSREESPQQIDLVRAREILDRDHQGMDSVKEHILEYLAVQKRVQKPKGPALCFLGPPGVGKTTLAQSIAEATGRKFVRISLAGANNEFVIRGHDRSFQNAKPGRIVEALKEAGTDNPVILLDEIDKMDSGGTHGDPASALLEVLDPAQNHAFKDNYESRPIDLSRVMFIATSNSFKIPKPLQDRMEIIELSRYSVGEKVSIAKKNIIPRAFTENGLKDGELTISDGALVELINEHSGEAGVRQLSRLIGTICRKAVKEIDAGAVSSVKVVPANLMNYIRKDSNEETRDYHTKLEKLADMPKLYKKGARELMELESIEKSSPQMGLIKTYLEWFFAMPWANKDQLNFDVSKAREILDRDHQGLDKVKNEVLEYLSVQNHVKTAKPKVMCLYGPPGVGKTTIAKSIAEATGRKFVRVSLGGTNTEMDIRGFARSFQSAAPGKIAQALKEAGTMNPVILLDEIDKLAKGSINGDPAAALLEVLDPAQNSDFKDNFLEVGIDLSEVLFIATANDGKISAPLLDRMEIIELSSYTMEEKLSIAQKSILPKILKTNGLEASQLTLNADMIKEIISHYTRESGVRQLTRVIDSVCRKALKEIKEKKVASVTITKEKLVDYLGNQKIPDPKPMRQNTVGVTQGLAWSQVGGGVMKFEAVVVPGKGQVVRTGNLGLLSQESIMAAMTVAKKMLSQYDVEPDFLKNKDIHVHAPEAVKKDGPSAGITITTSIVSAITNIPVSKDVCMTGEISLSGEVLPIGGLKEKLMAAHKLGLKTALIPIDNERDLDDLPQKVKDEMKIIPVSHISEVLKVALVKVQGQHQK